MKSNKTDFIFGIRPVIEAIKSGRNIDRIFIQKDKKNDLLKEIIKLAKKHHYPVSKVPREKLNRITGKNHQGCICYLSAVSFGSLDNIISQTYEKGEDPLILMLDRITDVRNFGAIARTADGAGVNCIIIPEKGSARINSDAIKTSAGALNYIPVIRETDLKKTIAYLQDNGIKVVACTEKSSGYIYDLDLTGPIAFILGSEENGIQPELIKLANENGKIPMKGNVDSLNVSVSAALVVYESLRQRIS